MLTRGIILVTLCCSTVTIHAQSKQAVNDSTAPAKTLDEIMLSAGNFYEKRAHIAQSSLVINAATIAASNAQNTGDLLIQTGAAFVQKSQQGGSSPVLHGFEASRILLVIDGVRMNNAIYRSGHLQNIITTDQNSLQQLEIVYGPSSTTYGSDALGGTIQLITQSPLLSNTHHILSKGNAFTRYSSANQEKTIHADFNLGGAKWAWWQSYNYSDFSDLRMGNQYPRDYPNFGRRSQYVNTINGRDTILNNSDDRLQKYSGYRQWDMVQKVLFQPKKNQQHLLNVQVSNSNNVPRYDRLQDIRNGMLRYANWYYGPQQRFLAAYEFRLLQRRLADEIKININYQQIRESRQTRDIFRYDRFDSRTENVAVWGATFSMRKKLHQHELSAGLDAQLNKVTSTASRKNLLTNTIAALDTRYPDGNNRQNQVGGYLQHVYKGAHGKWILNDGIRFQYTHLTANVVNNSFFNLPFTHILQQHWSVTGNIGLVYKASAGTLLKANISSGFRAPNIDDLAKIFESSTAAKQVVVPNANIRPEYTYGADVTLSHSIGAGITVEANLSYTLFRNALIKAPFQLNGKDSILYNGVLSQVLANQNINRANVMGGGLAATAKLNEQFCFTGSIQYTKGYFKTTPNKPSTIYEKQSGGGYALVQKVVSSKPLDHIPPIFGRLGISYTRNRYNVTCFSLFNGWKHLDQYNADGEDNAQYATQDGMPAWITLNLKAAYTVNEHFHLTAAIENILDRNYRYFASGFSAAGRNIVLSCKVSW